MNEELVIETKPSRKDIDFLDDQINAFNYEATGFRDGKEVGIFVREGGVIVAGLWGWTWATVLYIDSLWVHESLRGKGEGTRLLQAAEAEGRRRGCVMALLETHSFQAPEFYPRFGYESFATLEGYPPGGAVVYFRKDLTATG